MKLQYMLFVKRLFICIMKCQNVLIMLWLEVVLNNKKLDAKITAELQMNNINSCLYSNG